MGLSGYISVSGTTISVDFTKRGSTAATQVATITITGTDGTNSFQETFTMTSTDCNVTLITPDPYLKIGATRSVGTSNNVF